jgi:hypothetical protein
MHACICIDAVLLSDERIADAGPAARTRARAASVRARVCACAIGRPRIRADTCERPAVGVDRVWLGSQAFELAAAFNANIASWNVLRVTIYTSAFGSVGLADCIKRGVYANWGSTLRTEYPTWSSLCPAPTSTPSTATPR